MDGGTVVRSYYGTIQNTAMTLKSSTPLYDIMENYSSRYFHDTWEEQQVATNQADLHTYTTDALQVTDAAKSIASSSGSFRRKAPAGL